MLELERHDRVALITLRRPDKRNALNTRLCVELREAVRRAVGPDRATGCRALVITGEGSGFCSGADLDEVYTAEFRDALYAMLHAVADAPVPVVAAVNGPAIGAGTQLAIAADLRIAAPTAVFAVPTARNGLAVDPWTVRRLALVAGQGHARAMLLAGDRLELEAARAVGMVTRTGGPAEALAWAAELAALAPLTVAYSKAVLNADIEPGPAAGAGPDRGLVAAFEACWASEDMAEGRRARQERRPPEFHGR